MFYTLLNSGSSEIFVVSNLCLQLSSKHSVFTPAVFSGLLDRKTAFLDLSSSKKLKSSSLLDKVSIYRYLLLFPMEYFSWQLLNNLMKRALAADSAISRLLSENDSKTTDTLTVLRVFLKRAYIYCGSISQDSVSLLGISFNILF